MFECINFFVLVVVKCTALFWNGIFNCFKEAFLRPPEPRVLKTTEQIHKERMDFAKNDIHSSKGIFNFERKTNQSPYYQLLHLLDVTCQTEPRLDSRRVHQPSVLQCQKF
jgi:hypothetical protein